MMAQSHLLVARPVQALNPLTLRIADRRQGGDEALKARGHAFQLTAEEAR